MFALFIFLTETVLGYAAIQTTGNIQVILVTFAVGFPVLTAAGFFSVLWVKPWVLYPPGEYTTASVRQFVDAMRPSTGKVVRKTADVDKAVKVEGNPDRMKLLFKAQANSWMKSTKAMPAGAGCVVQVTTKELNPDGSWAVAEALTYVPGVELHDDPDGKGSFLAPRADILRDRRE
jgi:hypothetical protein